MLKNLKLRVKILLMLLLISLITAGIVGTITLTLGTSTLKEESYKKLTAIRELKANQIENYFQLIFDQVISFSESRTVVEAAQEFKEGFDRIGEELNYSKLELQNIDSSLKVYYGTQFLDSLYYRDSTINYFSIPKKELTESQRVWLYSTNNLENEGVDLDFPRLDPSDFNGHIKLSGSSTVSGLVNHIVKLFKEQGATGDITYKKTGSVKGLDDLINGSETQIAGLSHEISENEIELFLKTGQKPVSFRIGTDAVVVVVGKQNNFIKNLSTEQLKQAFSTAEKWSEIDPSWPDETINRFIPSEGSGSYNLFSDKVFDGDKSVLKNTSNSTYIKNGERLADVLSEEAFTIAFYSYNYYQKDSQQQKISIDNIPLDNESIRNELYPFTRPLYLVTTEKKLKSNNNISILSNYFLNSVDDEVGTSLSEIEYWPQHQNHRILQYQYIVDNPFRKGEKSKLVSSNSKTSYNDAHRKYHNIFKHYMDRFGFYDIFLVDADSGHIIYSVSKEVDFATDIMRGPHNNTNLSAVSKKANESDHPDNFYFEDFTSYLPSYNAPASFIASPIFKGEEKIGVLIFQLPIDKINHIMTDGYEWEKVGLGKSGETYLVGHDYLIRNQSRFLVEDPEKYFRSLEKTNLSHDIISKIKILNSAIGLQPVITQGTQAAIVGDTDTQIFSDYRGIEVLSAYKPLDIAQVNWVIMSEIDKEEAFEAIPVMIQSFIYWFIILIIIVFVLSFLFARSISRPVQMLAQRASNLAHGNLDDSVIIEQSDEIGLLADNFEKMRRSIKKLVVDLKDINQNLEKKVDQRTNELNRAKEAADTILDKSPVPVAVVDISSTKFLRVNNAMTEFNKLKSSELLEIHTLEIYFNVEKDRLIVVDQLREFGKVENLELQLKRIGTGEERWGLVSIHPIKYFGKEVYITSIIDITERKHLEEIVIKAKERMEGELNVAKDIQMSMLPLIFPAFPKRSEIDLYASLIPAREVGGDFYDFYFLDENHICFVVGDVSGKGVPAALMMAVTKTLLKSQAGIDKSTASIITHVNNEIAKDNDTYMFITVFMAILNTNTGELVYSNAGHNPSYILNKDKPELIKLGDLHGPVVGAMENMTYKESTLFINKNDIVIAYTDGITEAQNTKEELYSDERFIEFLLEHRHENPKEIINHIIDSVKTFEDGAEQFDDITVLAVEYIQEPNTILHDRTSLEIKNDLKEITTVIDHFEEFGTKNNISFPVVQKFNIAFDELLNNNISYGFQDDKEHLIKINIEIKGSRLIITISDDGMPFNPFVNDPPDTKLNVEERGIGGLGIHIVKSLMDEYDYKRNADKNVITLVKHDINK